MDMEEEPDTADLQAMAIQNLGIGICPASYNWRQHSDGGFDFGSDRNAADCGKCSGLFDWHDGGYRCEGGSHFFCQSCVQIAVDDKVAGAKRRAARNGL